MSNKMLRKSLLMALSDKAKKNLINLINGQDNVPQKTKEANLLIQKIFSNKPLEKILTIYTTAFRSNLRGFKNLSYLILKNSLTLNTYDVIKSREILFLDKSLKGASQKRPLPR